MEYYLRTKNYRTTTVEKKDGTTVKSVGKEFYLFDFEITNHF